jgi:virulence-associated protein VagC
VIVPSESVWDDFFDDAGAADFPNREQPEAQAREQF